MARGNQGAGRRALLTQKEQGALSKKMKGTGSKEMVFWEKGAAKNWKMEQGAREIIKEHEEKS